MTDPSASTMQRVAQIAGVSIATVSRYFSGTSNVSPTTAARVHSAAKQIGFAPRCARSPGRLPVDTSASVTVAVVVVTGSDSTLSPFASRLMGSIFLAADRAGWTLAPRVVSHLSEGFSDRLARSCSGLLCLCDRLPKAEEDFRSGLPTVWLLPGHSGSASWGDEVTPDDEAIGVAAGRYLTRAGHRRLAFVGEPDDVNRWPSRLRRFGFYAAASDASAVVRRVCGGAADAFAVDPSSRAESTLDAILLADDAPTGLFIDGRRLLPLVSDLVRRRGIRLGSDAKLEIVVHDEGASESDTSLGGFARVEVDHDALARCALAQLGRRIRRPNASERTRVLVEPLPVEPAASCDLSFKAAPARAERHAAIVAVR